jgi:nitroimidazol reductase NimA-like FMN-containing flavoprotein (pyridoxamine 5'-phosphate oxidase superfamily)
MTVIRSHPVYPINLVYEKVCMLAELSIQEIEDLLHDQIVGRIGCHDGDVVYVVPISYAYQENVIYCHSYEGKKMELMRKSPKVCFQVDEMKDMANWKSVIAWGDFEELQKEKEKVNALIILLNRKLPIPSSITTHLGEHWPFTSITPVELNKIPGTVFKITLVKKTGRIESTSESPSIV